MAPSFRPDQLHPPTETSEYQALLQRWVSFATVQNRILSSLCSEISGTSADVEIGTSTVSSAFQEIVTGATAQSRRVEDLSKNSANVEIEGGKTVSVTSIIDLFEDVLSDVVTKIVTLSRNAMEMVYTLDKITGSVAEIEGCVGQVGKINRQTTMLAMNARIEAARAGEFGLAFAVVANEVRELSHLTQTLSATMQTHIDSVSQGIKNSYEALKQVATVDMSANLLAKDTLDSYVRALIRQTEILNGIIIDSAKDNNELTQKVSQVVTRIQFQDRAKQRLDQVLATIGILEAGLTDLQDKTIALDAGVHRGESAEDLERILVLAKRFSLSEMRQRFIQRVVNGQDISANADDHDTSTSSGGSIELF